MKRDRIIIFVLVGVMLFSAVATGLLFLTQDTQSPQDAADALNDTADSQLQTCEPSQGTLAIAGSPEGEWPFTTEPVSGLQSLDTREGLGAAAALGQCITVHYRLALADGTPIDGNDTFGQEPISFELQEGALIDGWIQGIPGMKEGGLRRLIVPPELGYGSTERPGIPANSTLVFDVELVKIEF